MRVVRLGRSAGAVSPDAAPTSRCVPPNALPRTRSLRMIHVHMIGEYARHNGHADVIREHIDGATGR
nr:DUF664 domain-containing protein [Rhodococcus sp. AW25M09]